MRRTFLFLQGPATPFFAHLADRLLADGHRVFKLNFNAGDWAYWAPRACWHFRGRPESLRDFLDDKYRKFGITDQVLFGDRRPVHRPAVEHAEVGGVRTHVYEEGYFRPYWVTLERRGLNGHSLLPRDPHWFREVGGRLPDPPQPVRLPAPFHTRAIHDVLYHLAGMTNPVFFQRYRTHAPLATAVEYAGYVKRLPMVRLWHRRRDADRIAALINSGKPFYFLPLQLNSDAQIRDHSRFADMRPMIEYVMESFARCADTEACLVIKNHPLSPGLAHHARTIAKAATRLGMAGRVLYLESGDLELLLRHAGGCVTVNSTTGIEALGLGCPTTTLSDPIYNLPGLTFQGGLDDFWRKGEKPDAELFSRFRRVVMRATQIDGGFYCRTDIALAIENSLPLLTSELSSLETLL
jgi:capsular polysaccharide export protein